MLYDVVIIGGASAGLTAGIYVARKKLNGVILTKEVGGQSILTDNIENFPGFEKISGVELTDKIRVQVENLGLKIKEGIEVKSIVKKDGFFNIVLKAGGTVEAKSIIITTGKNPRMLGVPGEKEFENKGVSFCSICDAPLFSKKNVAVIGGGNSGLESATDLIRYANKVYVLECGPKILGDETTQEKLRRTEKVEFVTSAEVKEIKGDNFVEKIIYKNKETDEEKEISVGGVFVNIGWVPATKFLDGFVKLNDNGEIITDPKTNKASIEGVFAAGDCTDIKYKQCIVAAGEGAKAALSAYDYLINQHQVN